MPVPHLNSKWTPEPGWIILLTSLKPEKVGKIIIPESARKRGDTGIVVRVHPQENGGLMGQEVLIPPNDAYEITDSETDETFMVVKADHIIISRPAPVTLAFRRLKGEELDAAREQPEVATLQR